MFCYQGDENNELGWTCGMFILPGGFMLAHILPRTAFLSKCSLSYISFCIRNNSVTNVEYSGFLCMSVVECQPL